jgi:methyltransferase (TIGR00027 family)
MDSRSYRLDWPAATRVFELDQPAVIDHKQAALVDAVPRCERVAIRCDLAEDWVAPLEQAGFQHGAASLWLVEGLIQYLDANRVAAIFSRIDALSPSGSVTLFDVVGESLLRSPVMAPTLQMMRELGAPWIFGSDDPAALLAAWRANVTEPAIVGNAFKRWPFPAAPPGVPGVPRGYLIEAAKP